MSKTPAKAASSRAKKPAVKARAKSPPRAPLKKKAAPAKPVARKAAPSSPRKSAARSTIKPTTKAVAKAAKSVAKPNAKAAIKKPVTRPAPAKAQPKATSKMPVPAPAAVAAQKSQTPPLKTTPPKSDSGGGRRSAAVAAASAVSAAANAGQRSVPLPPPSRPAPPSNVVDLPRPVRKIDPRLVNVWKTKPGRELTEDELFAMPESEYMNDKQLDFFRAELERQRNDLLDNAGETTEHLREDTTIVPDPADRATIEEEHALELRTRDRERKLLKKISQSLARIDSGEYGFCDETGEPIGLGRLLARPTATLSLEAQQRREMKQKMFGD